MMYKNSQKPPNRCGAALIIALVLLTVLGVVAGAVLPQILRDRQEIRQKLVRIQCHQLLGDAICHAEAKRQSDSAFSGGTWTLGPDVHPFPGTFSVTTRYENDALTAEVEYRNEEGKTIYTVLYSEH